MKKKESIREYIDALEFDTMNDVELQEMCNTMEATADVIFKYMIAIDHELSQYLRNTLIQEITGISAQKTKVLSNEVLPEEATRKRLFLDILLEDSVGHWFDFEMQLKIRKETLLRFQEYIFRLTSNQLRKGDAYTKAKPVYQIVFMKYVPRGCEKLLCYFEIESGTDIKLPPYSTLFIVYVFMPVINRIAKVKTFEEMSKIEKICYLYIKGVNSDIMKSKERVVKAFIALYMIRVS